MLIVIINFLRALALGRSESVDGHGVEQLTLPRLRAQVDVRAALDELTQYRGLTDRSAAAALCRCCCRQQGSSSKLQLICCPIKMTETSLPAYFKNLKNCSYYFDAIFTICSLWYLACWLYMCYYYIVSVAYSKSSVNCI